jgi:hypothetical protein
MRQVRIIEKSTKIEKKIHFQSGFDETIMLNLKCDITDY